MNSRIHYTKPSITELEVRYAADAAANGWGERCYDYIHRFERDFSQYLGVEFAIATSSCTGALHIGLAALGIGPGDEVIMADTNWVATASPAHHLGATPVFVDICPSSWCIDPVRVEQAITPRTRAIVAMHIYGNLCEMDQLLAIGRKYNIPVIEDAAEAIGSVYHGKRAGSIGRFGVFSFHGSKTLTTGEGGMFVTNDPTLYEHVLTLSNHGRARNQEKQFWPDVIGFKYKMSNIQAALGCAQLERIEELVERKREIFHRYADGFRDLSEIAMNPELEGTRNGYWMPNAVLSKESGVTREALMRAFKTDNIDGRVFFWPLSSLPMFSSVSANTVANDLPSRAINLPSYHDLTHLEQERVIAQTRAVVHSTR